MFRGVVGAVTNEGCFCTVQPNIIHDCYSTTVEGQTINNIINVETWSHIMDQRNYSMLSICTSHERTYDRHIFVAPPYIAFHLHVLFYTSSLFHSGGKAAHSRWVLMMLSCMLNIDQSNVPRGKGRRPIYTGRSEKERECTASLLCASILSGPQSSIVGK